MRHYFLTVFNNTGKRLLNESFEAASDNKAQEIGKKRLDEEGYTEYTHRCVSQSAELLLFHR